MGKKIAIIGAGCSGLAAIKTCLAEGLEPVCFERDDDIGGLWNYTEDLKPGRGCVYKSCIINTSKEMMAFTDFPMPKEFPAFMPHRYVLKYLKLYASNFDLVKHIIFNRSVENTRPTADHDITGRWEVFTRPASDCSKEPVGEVFDGVMICTGHHCYPNLPAYPGLNKFKGITMHSHDYRKPDPFEDKKVLIVGIGNSAVDIAVDLSRRADEVFVSTRRGAWIINRMGPWGIPADALANSRFMFSLPTNMMQWLVEKMANYRFDHETYGVKPIHRALEAHPTINDEFPQRIMTGDVKVKPDIQKFTKDGVIFEDGTFQKIDTIIFATGYNYQFKFVDEDVIKMDRNDTSLFKYTFPPNMKHQTLGVIGLVQAIGSTFPIAEMQCRWVTKVLKGDVQLPSQAEMELEISEKKSIIQNQYVQSKRHTLQTFWISFMDQIAEQIGCKPDFKKLFLEDPWLALRCYFGPCVPAQYRLHGPDKWDGAKECIKDTFQNMAAPTKTRTVVETTAQRQQKLLIKFVLYFILFALVWCIISNYCMKKPNHVKL